ncbi:hypothetical protein [Mesorhizobium escarrei]|uniref:Lectin-like protein BA14k n=1 Tax=Mesorhizobium escarrei TaxID=666018 RepID=A0ABN8K9G2_9HYPH|nr:hypothetical protein [Mesorhizobium escarrei]CAH2406052.1 conserved exported hypothetical protein [Mesorhizobium escarrei]
MRRSTTILATFVLGAMLATGSATISMARGGGSDGHVLDFSGGGIGNRQRDHQHRKVFLSDPGYHYQPWWNYDTDAAYCSFDAVNPSYYGSNGMWHSCP